MCRRIQLIGIILLSLGVGLIIASIFGSAVLQIVLGIIALTVGLCLLK